MALLALRAVAESVVINGPEYYIVPCVSHFVARQFVHFFVVVCCAILVQIASLFSDVN